MIADFNQVDVVVYTKTTSIINTRHTTSEVAVTAQMASLPASKSEMRLYPEGTRISDARAFWCDSRVGNEGDQIEWNGARYRIHAISDYTHIGEHVRYYASLDV